MSFFCNSAATACVIHAELIRRSGPKDEPNGDFRAVHEELPEHGVFDCFASDRKRRGGTRYCAGGISKGVRALRRTAKEPDGRRLVEDSGDEPLPQSHHPVSPPLELLFRVTYR